jgi:hypothetical protein
MFDFFSMSYRSLSQIIYRVITFHMMWCIFRVVRALNGLLKWARSLTFYHRFLYLWITLKKKRLFTSFSHDPLDECDIILHYTLHKNVVALLYMFIYCNKRNINTYYTMYQVTYKIPYILYGKGIKLFAKMMRSIHTHTYIYCIIYKHI